MSSLFCVTINKNLTNTESDRKENKNLPNPPSQKKVPHLFYALVTLLVIFFVGGIIELYHVSFDLLKPNENPSPMQFFTTTIFSLFVLVGISVQAIIYWLQWRQTRELFELGQRPSLGVEEANLIQEAGKPFKVYLKIRNSGRSPAKITKVITYPGLYPLQMIPVGDCPDPVANPQSEGMNSKPVVPVNGTRIVPSYFDNIFNPIESAAFEEETAFIFVWCKINYERFGGAKYFIEYYAKYLRDDDAFSECSAHNHAD